MCRPKVRTLKEKIDLYKRLNMNKTEIYERLVMDERNRHGKQTAKTSTRLS